MIYQRRIPPRIPSGPETAYIHHTNHTAAWSPPEHPRPHQTTNPHRLCPPCRHHR
ncbi:hypothetical protein BDR03DRAFT_969246 [Suillus americanus]|nr:hypothetical protein BDR03DRAFT_969246 [Suillus americanus]